MLGRILAVIDFCLDQTEPVSLAEMAEATGLPKPTAWRIAQSLVDRHLLDHTVDGYTSGVGLVVLGDRAAEQSAMRAAITPQLADLHRQTRAAVWAVDVRSDVDWPLVDSIYDTVVARTRYAESWPHSPDNPALLGSALGILAYSQRPGDVEPLLRAGVPRLTPYTEVAPRLIESALRRARDAGEVVEHGRFRLGWSCLAVPITDRKSGETVAVLGVVDRTPRFVSARLLRAAHASAAAISQNLPSMAGA